MREIRIVVVDDEEKFADHIVWLAGEWMKKKNIPVKIERYIRSEGILAQLGDNINYDIYILDVEMPVANGFQLAKRIRETDESAYLLFLTSHDEWALKGYEVRAYDYIPKENYQKLREDLYKITDKLIKEAEDFYILRFNRQWQKINVSDIVFLTKDGKNTIFHCKRGICKERKALREVSRQLPREYFISIDRGTVVNLQRVQSLQSKNVIMSSGECLDVSQSDLDDVKKRLMEFYKG